MNIEEYFTAQTKPIKYSKMPDGCWTIKNGRITVREHPPLPPDAYSNTLAHEQQSKITRMHYENNYIGQLNGNACLVHYLSMLDDYFMSSNTDFPSELYSLGHFRHRSNIEWVHAYAEDIWGTYLCYRYLIWEDDCAYSILLSKIIIPWNTQFDEDPFAFENVLNIYEDHAETCWNYLRSKSGRLGEESNSIQCEITIQNGKVVEYLFATTLADALLYQLFMHIAIGKEGIFKKYKLANCELCHSQFMKKHGNARFCEKCAKNDVRVAACRSKKKGVQLHAQETHP